MHAAPSSGHKDGETYYKAQLEGITKARKALQERLEIVERENRDLRRTVYELTLSFGKGQNINAQNQQAAQAIDLDAALQVDNTVFDHDEVDKADTNLINFACKVDLAAHAGAVYAIAFSPCGRYTSTHPNEKAMRSSRTRYVDTEQRKLMCASLLFSVGPDPVMLGQVSRERKL